MDKYDLLLKDEEIKAIRNKVRREQVNRLAKCKTAEEAKKVVGNVDAWLKDMMLEADREITQAELKKVVKAVSRNGWWNNGQTYYCISKEFYLGLKKIAGVK